MKRIKFFASILLMLCLSIVCCAQTKIDWKQIKNIPDTLEFKNVLLEHLLFKSAYQPVMESIHQGAIYYDNMLERLRVYEHGQWRDLSVSIASDSIGAPLTILGYLQASDIYASQSAYIGKDVNVKGNVNASGTSTFNYLKVNNALKVPTVASATLGVGSVYYDTSANKLKVLNSSNQWKVVSVDVDSALSTTSTNPVENKVISASISSLTASLTYNVTAIDNQIKQVNINMLASLSAGLNAAEASTTTAIAVASAALDAQFNAEISSYSNTLKSYIDLQDTKTLASATKLFVSDVATSTVTGTISVTKNGTTTNVKVAGFTSMVPVGTVLAYMGDIAPEGFLMCDGSVKNRIDFPDLFDVIGHKFDADNQSNFSNEQLNDSNYFSVPDLSARFLEGTPVMTPSLHVPDTYTGKKVEAGLPEISGSIDMSHDTNPNIEAFGETINPTLTGAFSNSLKNRTNKGTADGESTDSSMLNAIVFNASLSNSIYGNSTTVQPPAIYCKYIIKY